MRVVVDMQGAQTASRFSTKECDTISLIQAMVRNSGQHEIVLVVNDLLAESIEPIRAAFDGLVPQERIRAFSVVGPVRENDPKNARRREIAERLREAFLRNQSPDVILVTGLFEGFDNDAVTSIGVFDEYALTAVILPDALPLPETELHRAHHARKIDSLARAALSLSRADKSRGEAAMLLPAQLNLVVDIGQASLDESAKRIFAACELLVSSNDNRRYGDIAVEKTGIFLKQRKKKILLTKLDHRGDFLLAFPAISRLQARYPDAELHIVVGSWNVAAAKDLGLFSKVISFDYFNGNPATKPELDSARLATLLEQLEAYDIAIDLRRHFDTRFLVTKVSAGLKVGYETLKPEVDALLDIALPAHHDVPFDSTPHDRIHMSVQLLRLIDSLPQQADDYVVLPALGPHAMRDRPNVAVFPTAGLVAKEWPIECYAELVRCLSANSAVARVNVYFASATDAARLAMGPIDKVSFHIGLSFPDLVKSLSDNAVCVANNSFGGHIAGYLGVTVIAIYSGHNTVAQWGVPFGDSYVIHRPVPCSPCHLVTREACQYGVRCLDIPVDFVRAKVEEALKSLAAKSSSNGAEINTVATKAVRITADNVAARLVRSIAACYGTGEPAALSEPPKLTDISAAIARSLRPPSSPRQLLVDVSELSRHDAKSGVQRVVRSVLKEWLLDPPHGYAVEPVYARMDAGYRYARRFTANFLGLSGSEAAEEPIEYSPGDIFFGLDHQAHVVRAHRDFFRMLRRHGVRVSFLVHDLLAVRLPQYFMPGIPEAIANWLEVVAEADGAVCVSRTVADDLADWLKAHRGERRRPFKISWNHNGGDVENSVPSTGLPKDAAAVLDRIRNCTSFLSVGTVEPRKGYSQAVEAFNRLWQQGRDVCLVIVGSQGWQVDDLAATLRNHPQLGDRLFWLEKISDEYLERLYAACTCLLAASEGEGFGLPLVEAARHKLPIIARDIPVFREIMGERAFYFSARDPGSIAAAIDQWLLLHGKGKHPKSDALEWVTWKQSAKHLQQVVLGDECYLSIEPRITGAARS